MYELFKDALSKIPMTDVQRAHIELLIQMTEKLDRDIEQLRQEKAELSVKLDQAQTAHQRALKELEALNAKHHEEIRIVEGVEFISGRRTGYTWMPFCPVCHTPAEIVHHEDDGNYYATCTSNAECRWGKYVKQSANGLASSIRTPS